MSDYDRFEKIFCGTWRHDRDENIQAFLDKKELPEDIRKGFDAPSSVTYTRLGSKIKFTREKGADKFEASLSFGEEVEHGHPDKPLFHAKITSTMVGDTVHQDILGMESGKHYTNVISVDGDELINTMTYKDVTLRRVFKRA